MPSSPNAVSSLTTDTKKYVEPLTMQDNLNSTREKLLCCLESMGNNAVIRVDSNYIYTVFTTPLLRFRDDVELLIDETDQQVHFRSASRLGYSEMGANRKCYNALKWLYGA